MNMFIEFRPIMSTLLRSKTGAILIALQIALTLAVLCNALYIVADRLSMATRPSGAAEDEVFQIGMIALNEISDPLAMQLADEEALRAIPGVKFATWASQVPLGTSSSRSGLAVNRSQRSTSVNNASVYMAPNSLIDVLGLKLIEGRDFTSQDTLVRKPRDQSNPPSAINSIISLATAKAMFPDARQYVGKSIYWGIGDDAIELPIVGVVETLQAPPAPTNITAEYSFIMPTRMLESSTNYLVRTNPEDLNRVMAEAEKILTELRSDRIFFSAKSINELRKRRYTADIALSNMLVTVCVLMLLVTASGIVGMASLWVNQRRKQIGVRRALGASKHAILRYFVMENIIISSIGVLLGVMATLLLNQILVNHLELSRLPLSLLVYGSLTIFVLGIIAVFGPAWRGASIPAAEATRSV